eukprot:364444-Chlamydomonas_euryale.AAC.12
MSECVERMPPRRSMQACGLQHAWMRTRACMDADQSMHGCGPEHAGMQARAAGMLTRPCRPGRAAHPALPAPVKSGR